MSFFLACTSQSLLLTSLFFSSYEHPYEQEIKKSHYPSSTYSKVTPQMYTSFDSTVATFVNTMDGVREMLAELKSAKEIAIDLEHHDTHSYHGLVCLMQISTREKDWIVDTLLPWREELQILNEVFADPNIMKVLHGSTMDVIWLQRDLGLYLVGLFDTYHAAVSLNYPKKSLKYLLEKFVNFQADKKYQMADWRLRPLLPGMFDYARSDTHYLLYIYDQLRNELIDNSTPQDNLIDYVQERSKSEALQRYERPVYDAETGQGAGGWYDVLYRGSSLLSREQLSVFKAVHQWRDQTARTEDEGPQSVLSKRALFAIAYGMPTDQAALLKLASPVSPALRKRLTNLLKVIKEAKIAGADGPELHEVLGTGAAKVMTERPVTTVPDELEIAPPSSEFQAIAMRAGLSQFWGTTLERSESTNVSPYASLAASDTLELSLPLPAAPINISDEPMRTGDDTAAVESTATTTPPSPEAPDQIFTVKQFGAPPKRKTAPNPVDSQPASSSSSSPSSPSDAAEDHSQSSSSSSSPAPTPKKKQKQKHNPNTATENMIPFDYANADSVLQAAPRPGNDGRNLPRKPQFNPYAKSLNAPQGLRRVKKDMGGGRSLTFQK